MDIMESTMDITDSIMDIMDSTTDTPLYMSITQSITTMAKDQLIQNPLQLMDTMDTTESTMDITESTTDSTMDTTTDSTTSTITDIMVLFIMVEFYQTDLPKTIKNRIKFLYFSQFSQILEFLNLLS